MNNTLLNKLARISCLIGIAIAVGCAIIGIHCLLYFGFGWAVLAIPIFYGIAVIIKFADKKGSKDS